MWISKDKYLELKIASENYKTARDYADELRHKLDIRRDECFHLQKEIERLKEERHELIMMRTGGEVSE